MLSMWIHTQNTVRPSDRATGSLSTERRSFRQRRNIHRRHSFQLERETFQKTQQVKVKNLCSMGCGNKQDFRGCQSIHAEILRYQRRVTKSGGLQSVNHSRDFLTMEKQHYFYSRGRVTHEIIIITITCRHDSKLKIDKEKLKKLLQDADLEVIRVERGKWT